MSPPGSHTSYLPWWSWLAPVAAVVVLALAILLSSQPLLAVVAGLVLVATVFAAVHHAEIVAYRIGEPFGTLMLAVAVTIIEVALIVSVMIGSPTESTGLARDTAYAAVMIACNGIVGLSLLAGGVRHHEQDFHEQGASAALAVLAALTVLALVVPTVTTSAPGAEFSPAQLVFSAVASLTLYCSYVFVQTISHRNYFLPVGKASKDEHAPPPPAAMAMTSLALLIVSLVAVVGLAKYLTPSIEFALERLHAPKSVVGIVIAGLVLLPEGLAALRAARSNRLQNSLNLALGSALATIGLTIPAVAIVAIWMRIPLQLGLGIKDAVLLSLSLLIGVITLGTGRTTVLQGIVHLVLFAAFVFFAVVP